MGSQPEGMGSRSEGMGSQPEGMGSRSEGMGSQPEGMGSQPEGMGSQSEGMGSQSEGMGSQQRAYEIASQCNPSLLVLYLILVFALGDFGFHYLLSNGIVQKRQKRVLRKQNKFYPPNFFLSSIIFFDTSPLTVAAETLYFAPMIFQETSST